MFGIRKLAGLVFCFCGTGMVRSAPVITVPSLSLSEPGFLHERRTTTFNLALSEAAATDITLMLRATPGTATPTGDYDPVPVSVTIPAGSEYWTVYLPLYIVGDADSETDETVLITITDLSHGTAGPPGVLTIQDTPPYTYLAETDVWEGTGGDTARALVLMMSKPATAVTTVEWEVILDPAGLSSADASDLGASSGTLTIPAGSMQALVPLEVFPDTAIERNERFTLRLNIGYNGCRILNDDQPTSAADSYAIAQGGRLTADGSSASLLTANDTGSGDVFLMTQPQGGFVRLIEPNGAFVFTPHPNTLGSVSFSYGLRFQGAVKAVGSQIEWRWLRPLDGIDPGARDPAFHSTWFLAGFDDSGWSIGPPVTRGARFADVRAAVPGAADTAYLRTRLQFTPGRHWLRINANFDDGAIMYLGGRELGRFHRPNALNFAVSPDHFGLRVDQEASVPDLSALGTGELSLSGIMGAGEECLAVSVHNVPISEGPTGELGFWTSVEVTDSTTVPSEVTIEIADGHLPPVLSADSFTGIKGAAISGNVFLNDPLFRPGGAAWDALLGAEIFVAPAGGRISAFDGATGAFTFEPDAGFTGDTVFSYRVRDKDGWSQPAEVLLRASTSLPLMPVRALEPRGLGTAASLRNVVRIAPTAVSEAPFEASADLPIALRGTSSAAGIVVSIHEPDGATLHSATWNAELPLGTVHARQSGAHRLRLRNPLTTEAEVIFDLVMGAAAAASAESTASTARPLLLEPGGSLRRQSTVLSRITPPTGSQGIIVATDNFNTGNALGPSWSVWQSDPAATIGIGTEGSYRGLVMRPTGTGRVTCEATLTVDPGLATSLNLACLTWSNRSGTAPLPPTYSGHAEGEGFSISRDGETWRAIPTSIPNENTAAPVNVNLSSALMAVGWNPGNRFYIRWQQRVGGSSAKRAVLDNVTVSATAYSSDWWKFDLTSRQTVEVHMAPLNHLPCTLSVNSPTGPVVAGTACDGTAPCRLRTQLDPGTWLIRVQGPPRAAFHLAVLTGVAQESRRALGQTEIEPPGAGQSAWTGHLAPAPSGLLRAGFIAGHGQSAAADSPDARVAAMVRSWNPDFVVSGGESNYSSLQEGSWETNVGNFYGGLMLARVDGLFPLQASRVQRFFPAIGDYYASNPQPAGGSNSQWLNYYHDNPGGSPRLPLDSGAEHASDRSYYRFQRGAAEFLLVDSSHALDNVSLRTAQKAWLNRYLPAGGARWRFVVAHHPPFCSGQGRGSQSGMQWNEWIPADAVLSADNHVYERLAMRDTLGLVCGLAGGSLHQFGAPLPETRFRFNGFHGALLITADSESARLEMRCLDDGANGANGGRVIDAVQLGEPSAEASAPDVMELPLTAGQSVTVRTLTPLAGDGTGNLLDPLLEILLPDNTVAAVDDDSSGDGRNAVLKWQAPTDVTARVRISRTTQHGGPYRILVDAPFDAWLADRITDAPLRVADADGDADDLTNLLEYVIGTNPAVRDDAANLLPVPFVRDGKLIIEVETSAAFPPDAVCELQFSPELERWTNLARLAPGGGWSGNVTEELLPPQRGGRRVQLTLAAPVPPPERTFVRLRASIQ
jgi:tartrate-resistant acid phosphatase type 5